MPTLSSMPPSDGKQYGVRTTSAVLSGSQKDILRPTVILAPEAQRQRRLASVSGSALFPEESVTPPSLIGKTQLQQTSVIGLMILPLQFPAEAEAAKQKDKRSIRRERFMAVASKKGVRTIGRAQIRHRSGLPDD